MTLDEALKIANERYGLQETYVHEKSGKFMYRFGAERELRAIHAVKLQDHGIELLAPEVISLARRVTTIEALVRRKNPELFVERNSP